MKKYFLLGLIIKFIFVAITFHLDTLFIWERPAHFIQNLHTIGSYYGPLTYITFGILSPIYFLSQHIGYWILKIPYLFVDFYILYLLIEMSPKHLHKRVLIFWWLNPIVIFSTYAMGQLDIILSLCVVLSVYLAKKSRVLPIICLGAGVAFKTMTLPLLLPATLIMGKRIIKRIKTILIGFSVPVLLAVLFLWPSRADIFNSYFPTGIVFYPKLSLTPDAVWEYFSLIIGGVSYFLLQLYIFKYKQNISSLANVLFSSLTFFIIAMPILVVLRYTVLMPLLVLVSLKNKKTFKLILIVILLMLGYVYTWPLQWGLIDHIYPQVKKFPALREFVATVFNYENAALVFRAGADALIYYLAIISLKKIFSTKTDKRI